MTPTERAIYLLRAVNRFISTSAAAEAHTIFYDETSCDGLCLALDCTIAADELEIETNERNGKVTPDEIRRCQSLSNFSDIYNHPETAHGLLLHAQFEMLQELTAQLAEIKELLKERKG